MTKPAYKLERAAPRQAGVSEAALAHLLDRAQRDQIQLHSLMVVRHGKVAAECWWKPYGPDIPHHLYSFSKSVTALAVGMAMDEGLLTLEDKVADFFPEKITPRADSRIHTLTVRHLLTMSSGINFNEVFIVAEGDWMHKFLNASFSFSPGEKFHYNSLNTYMLSAILSAVTGLGLVDYLTPRLFEPLGIADVRWDKCPYGIETGGWGLYLRTEDMAKFALLCLREGVWQGRRLVSAAWVREATTHQFDNASTSLGEVDSRHNTAGYGYQFWLCPTPGVYRADGAFGQYAVIWPEKDLVIAVTSGQGPQDAVLDLIWDTLIEPLSAPDPAGEWEVYPGLRPDPVLQQRMRALSLVPDGLAPHSPIESQVEGRRYCMRQNIDSVLPLMLRALDRIFLIGIRHFSLLFGEHGCVFDWREGCYLNSVPVSLDGRPVQSNISIGGHHYRVCCTGGWPEENLFELRMYFINTPHLRILRFRFFGSCAGVTLSLDESPSLKNSLGFVLDMKMAALPFQDRILHFTDKLVLPVTGRRDRK